MTFDTQPQSPEPADQDAGASARRSALRAAIRERLLVADGAMGSMLQGCPTTLGVSNVSFGLNPAARAVLNSVFLAECVQAGLDSAIVHASRLMPIYRIPDDRLQVALDLDALITHHPEANYFST